jgi:hypothetical protein
MKFTFLQVDDYYYEFQNYLDKNGYKYYVYESDIKGYDEYIFIIEIKIYIKFLYFRKLNLKSNY